METGDFQKMAPEERRAFLRKHYLESTPKVRLDLTRDEAEALLDELLTQVFEIARDAGVHSFFVVASVPGHGGMAIKASLCGCDVCAGEAVNSALRQCLTEESDFSQAFQSASHRALMTMVRQAAAEHISAQPGTGKA